MRLALLFAVAVVLLPIAVSCVVQKRENNMIVGAFYFMWYGRPGQWQTGHDYTPVLGEYDSRDPRVMAYHTEWARAAGIDFFMTSYNPRDEDGGSTHVVDAFTRYLTQPNVVPNAIAYEAQMALNPNPWQPYDFTTDPDGDGKTIGQQFVEDMQRLITYGWVYSPNYYKIDGRPVIYFWTFFLWRNWWTYLDQVVTNFKNAGLLPPYFIGNIEAWDPPDNPGFNWHQTRGRIQAVSSPLMYVDDNRLDNYYNLVMERWRVWRNVAESYGIRFVPAAIPGYSDRAMRGPSRRILPREDGNALRKHWAMAKEVYSKDLPMVTVTTFNEWHEGTQIEPALEYGTLYIETNKKSRLQSTRLWVDYRDLKRIVAPINHAELGLKDEAELNDFSGRTLR